MPTLLTTDRLSLRSMTHDDADAVLDLYSHEEVHRWVGGDKPMADRQEALALIERRMASEMPEPMGIWAIDVDSRLVGVLLLKPIPISGTPLADDPRNPDLLLMSDEVEVGWHLHPDVWGRGLATEAAEAVLEHARAHGLGRIVAVTHPDNVASQRLAVRLGMVDAGLTQRYYNEETRLFTLDPLLCPRAD